MINSAKDIEIENQDPEEQKEEVILDFKLRPLELYDFVGQESLKENMNVAIAAAKARNEQLEHVLFYGPPGLGKTTLAHIIAKEMGKNIKTTSGPAIEKAGDLASLLTNLSEGDVLFVDEIHRLNKVIEEILYPAMEDGVLDIVVGKGPGARSIRMELPKFTLVGATTRIGLISAPLRDRFGITYRLEYYEAPDLQKIISRSAKILGHEINDNASLHLAHRSRFTPRIANKLLKRVRDFAQVHGYDKITEEVTQKALDLLQIDNKGLDKNDRRILETLIDKFSGGPVGLNTLAAATGEEQDTITDVHEPFLIRQGLLIRTPKGRQVTKEGYLHLGKNIPEGQQTII